MNTRVLFIGFCGSHINRPFHVTDPNPTLLLNPKDSGEPPVTVPKPRSRPADHGRASHLAARGQCACSLVPAVPVVPAVPSVFRVTDFHRLFRLSHLKTNMLKCSLA